jgi:hypothetical protein
VCLDSHGLGTLKKFDRVALLERGGGFLPAAFLGHASPGAADFAGQRRGVDLKDLDLEERLDGLLDLALVGLGVDLEGHLVLVDLAEVAFFGDDRAADDAVGFH